MWIASNIGFYSVVNKPSHLNPDGPEVHDVRARNKDDLTRLSCQDQRCAGLRVEGVIRDTHS